MEKTKEKLAPFHVMILIFMTQSGVMAFILPQLLADNFGTNGWASLIGFGLLATLNVALIGLVYKLGKGRSIFVILEQAFPKFLIFPIYVAVASLWTMIGCLAGKEYVMIFQMFAFPTTNPMLFKLVLDVLVFWLLTKGIYNISKAATIFFWLFFWMVFLLFFFYGEFQWARLTPFLFKGGKYEWMKNVDIYSAFLGCELSMLLFSYSNKRTKLIQSTMWANLITTASYVYMAIMLFGIYSLKQLQTKNFPVLDALAYIRFPFVERVENLFYGFFMFSAIFSVLLFVWSAKEMLHQIVPKMKGNAIGFIIMAAAYFIAMIPDILNEVGEWLSILSLIEIGVAFGLPVVLIVVLLIQNNGGKQTYE